jgi:hypothetical protein
MISDNEAGIFQAQCSEFFGTQGDVIHEIVPSEGSVGVVIFESESCLTLVTSGLARS